MLIEKKNNPSSNPHIYTTNLKYLTYERKKNYTRGVSMQPSLLLIRIRQGREPTKKKNFPLYYHHSLKH